MKRVLLLTALLACGGQPVRTAADLMREADDAVSRGDLDAAEALYAEAEPLTADPGLVAFNKGVVLFRRGNFRQAELHWRRALADDAIPNERRARGLFNLGDALVKQAGVADAKMLQSAIACYELVGRESDDDGLKKDAAHNLELAKLLWAKAVAGQPPKDRDPNWENPDRQEPKQPPAPKKDDGKEPGDADPGKKANSKDKIDPQKGKGELPKGKDTPETPKQVPGAGNLPVINPTGGPVTPEDADAILSKTAVRLLRERQKLRQDASQGERFRPNDW